jgi:hypothetical protein
MVPLARLTRRLLVATTAAMLLPCAAAADPPAGAGAPIFRVDQRSRERFASPDGHSFAVIRSGDHPSASGDPPLAGLWLSRHGERPRLLARFERTGSGAWSSDSRWLVFVDEATHDNRLYVADLDHPRRSPRQLDLRLQAILRILPPQMNLRDREVWLEGLSGTVLTVSMLEAGLPLGRSEGPYVSRDRTFTVDLASTRIQVGRLIHPERLTTAQ